MNHSAAQEFLNGCTKEVLIEAYQTEYMEWKRTGVLPDGIIRDTYNKLSDDGDEYVGVQFVDKMFNERLAELFYIENGDNLTKTEAFKALDMGYQVSHRFFSKDEWLYKEDGAVFTEDGIPTGDEDDIFWSIRKSDEWNDGGWWVHN